MLRIQSAYNESQSSIIDMEKRIGSEIEKRNKKRAEQETEIIDINIKGIDSALRAQFSADKVAGENRRKLAKKVNESIKNDIIKSPDIPSALRPSAGASSLGGVAVAGSQVLDIQKSTLEVQKQILAEQKRLTMFWAGAN